MKDLVLKDSLGARVVFRCVRDFCFSKYLVEWPREPSYRRWEIMLSIALILFSVYHFDHRPCG